MRSECRSSLSLIGELAAHAKNWLPISYDLRRSHRRTLDKFLDIFHTRNMVKRPGLGKRKRVTLPLIEASEEPEQPEQPDELPATQASASDPGDTATHATQPEDTDDLEEATQHSQSQGRFKKKRLVRMTDGQEDEMAEWLKNHPEMYNKAKKAYRDTDRKEAAWATQARAMGLEGELD